MRKNIAVKLAATALCLSMMGIPGSAPAYAGTVDAILKTGGIQIGLEQKMLDESGNRVDPYEVSLHPTEEVSYIVSVKNDLSPAYIRLKLKYTGEFDGVDDSMLRGVSDKWVKQGDYWYYTEPVKTGSLTDFCTSLVMPEFPESTGVPVSVSVDADAVQSANFTPDFTSTSPWGDVEIQSHASFGDSVRSDSGDSGFHITFEDIEDGEMNESNDLFKNFRSLMPGDTVSEKITIKNEYNRPISIRLSSDNNDKDTSLNKWINVEIKRLSTEGTDEKVVYSGPLYGDDLEKDINLGIIGKDRFQEYLVTLLVDKNMPNSTMMQDYSVSWDIYSNNTTSGGSGGSGSPGTDFNTYDPNGPSVLGVDRPIEIPSIIQNLPFSDSISQVIGDIKANYRPGAKDSKGNKLTSNDASLLGKDGIYYAFRDGEDVKGADRDIAGNYKTGDVFPFAMLGGISIFGFLGLLFSGKKKKGEGNA
ncbi:MAG: hypothetical protein J6I76_16750 [Oribacterium sp.]|nr:hypothetical protein [Oribacterium sp.]